MLYFHIIVYNIIQNLTICNLVTNYNIATITHLITNSMAIITRKFITNFNIATIIH